MRVPQLNFNAVVAIGVPTAEGDWFFIEIVADGTGEDIAVRYKFNLFLFLHI